MGRMDEPASTEISNLQRRPEWVFLCRRTYFRPWLLRVCGCRRPAGESELGENRVAARGSNPSRNRAGGEAGLPVDYWPDYQYDEHTDSLNEKEVRCGSRKWREKARVQVHQLLPHRGSGKADAARCGPPRLLAASDCRAGINGHGSWEHRRRLDHAPSSG